MKDKYYAIFENGKASYADTWEDTPKISSVKMYLHGHFHHQHITKGGTAITWYRYEILDENGEHLNFRVEDFEVINIHPDNGQFRFFGRSIDILNTRLGTVHNYLMTYDSYEPIVESFYKELMHILTTLNTLGSWQAYEFIKKETNKDMLKLK